jgi:hypothetical protein
LSYATMPERAIVFLDEARRADPKYRASLLARGFSLRNGLVLSHVVDGYQSCSQTIPNR